MLAPKSPKKYADALNVFMEINLKKRKEKWQTKDKREKKNMIEVKGKEELLKKESGILEWVTNSKVNE